MTAEKSEFARPAQQGHDIASIPLVAAIKRIRPTALVGATAKRGTFSQDVVESLTEVGLSL